MKKPLPAFTRAPHEHYEEYVEDLRTVSQDEANRELENEEMSLSYVPWSVQDEWDCDPFDDWYDVEYDREFSKYLVDQSSQASLATAQPTQ